MHPNQTFHWQDQGDMLSFLAEQPFCTLFVSIGGQTRIAHAPVAIVGTSRLRFHLARSNPAAKGRDGTLLTFSCLGPHAYVSPDWYGSPDQVPTWNYIAIEGEGPLRRLNDQEIVDLLDQLSAAQEARLEPKPAWTRDKMGPEPFEAMLRAIVGFEVEVEGLRGTRKLGQNKPAEERVGVVAALRAIGNADMAAIMERGG